MRMATVAAVALALPLIVGVPASAASLLDPLPVDQLVDDVGAVVPDAPIPPSEDLDVDAVLEAVVEPVTGVTAEAREAVVEPVTGVTAEVRETVVEPVTGVTDEVLGSVVEPVTGVTDEVLGSVVEPVTGVTDEVLDAVVEPVTGVADDVLGGAPAAALPGAGAPPAADEQAPVPAAVPPAVDPGAASGPAPVGQAEEAQDASAVARGAAETAAPPADVQAQPLVLPVGEAVVTAADAYGLSALVLLVMVALLLRPGGASRSPLQTARLDDELQAFG